jgi:hypothetical protein
MRRSARLAQKDLDGAIDALEKLSMADAPKTSRSQRPKASAAPLSAEAAAIRDVIFKTPCNVAYKAARPSPPRPSQAAPIAVIVAGPAGAGKTTVYASVLPAWFLEAAQYANVDVYSEYFMAVHDLLALPAADRKALNLAAVMRGAMCTAADLKRWMAERRHLVIDKPCDKAKETQALVADMRKKGYDVYMLVVKVTKETALARPTTTPRLLSMPPT